MAIPLCAATGKVSHASRGKAIAHLAGLAQANGPKVHVYFCASCGGFHVGHERDLRRPFRPHRRKKRIRR